MKHILQKLPIGKLANCRLIASLKSLPLRKNDGSILKNGKRLEWYKDIHVDLENAENAALVEKMGVDTAEKDPEIWTI